MDLVLGNLSDLPALPYLTLTMYELNTRRWKPLLPHFTHVGMWAMYGSTGLKPRQFGSQRPLRALLPGVVEIRLL